MKTHHPEQNRTVMKKLFTLFAITLIGFLLLPEMGKASHFAGVDITYTYQSPGQWLVRMKLYRDCAGISAPTTVNICYSSASTGLSGTVTAPQLSMTPVPNTPCVTATPSCPGGIGDIEEYIYEAIVNLPAPATDWVFSWADCCRNGAITTLQPNGIYVAANLNSVVAPTNSSPTFSNLAYTRFCVGNQFFYDQGATDIDGDSLVFSLVTAEDGNFGACPNNPFPNTYIAPFTPQNFCSSSIPISIDGATGVINFIPSQIQVAVMCVLVREYRNGVLIGQVKRDIQINIVAQCNQIFPSFNNSILNATGGQLFAGCNDRQVIIPFDTTFQCGSAVPTDLRVLSPFGIPNPAIAVQPINCSNGETDSLLVTFLNPLTHGSTYVWIKRGLDGNTLLSECGSEIPEFQDTVNIVVVDNSVWAPATDSVGCIFNDFTVTLLDSVYCFSIANDGSDVRLVDGAGTNYPIANVFGYCSPNGLKTNELLVRMSANTSAAGPLYLIVNNAGGSDGNTVANNCGRFLSGTDTLAILYIDNIIPINLGSDQTICSFDPYPVLDCGYANISYQWYSASGAISGATQQTYTPTAAGSYSVVASGGPGCSGTDTVVVNVIPAAVDNLGADQLLCITDPMPSLDAGNAGATYQWFLDGTAVSGATSQTYTPTPALPAGSYTVSVEVNTGNAQCIANFNVVLQVVSAPVVSVADQSVCQGVSAVLDATSPSATSYLWPDGSTNPTFSTPTAGDYIVTVSIGNCSTIDTATVTVKPFPAAPTVACNPGGGSGFKFVYVWSNVPGNNGYEVSEDGGATWIPANQISGPESHGVNISIDEFIVRATVDANSTQLCGPGAESVPAPCQVEIPNIFTPNGDGKNEFFEIKNINQHANNTVQIFNRWGKEVYSASGYNNDSKKFDGKDLPDGVYFYIIDLGNGETPFNGTVNIHR